MYIIKLLWNDKNLYNILEMVGNGDKYVFNKRTLVDNKDYARKFSSINYANTYLSQCEFFDENNCQYEIVVFDK